MPLPEIKFEDSLDKEAAEELKKVTLDVEFEESDGDKAEQKRLVSMKEPFKSQNNNVKNFRQKETINLDGSDRTLCL